MDAAKKKEDKPGHVAVQSYPTPTEKILERLAQSLSGLEAIQKRIALIDGSIGKLSLKLNDIDQRLKDLETGKTAPADNKTLHFLDFPPEDGSGPLLKVMWDSTLVEEILLFVQDPEADMLFKPVPLSSSEREAYLTKMKAAGCVENRWYWPWVG